MFQIWWEALFYVSFRDPGSPFIAKKKKKGKDWIIKSFHVNLQHYKN